MSVSVGIDLGTTFSVISFLKDNNQVEVIPNKLGNRTTPSIVTFDDEGNVLVGELALQSNFNNRLISNVKRSMGTSYRYEIDGKNYSPEEISSEILKYLKECAEDYLGEEIESAVITVPAYFNNDQRQSTKLAGELAGLKVSRIINEPTAASIAYGIDKKNDATILVYDLGGGTFDVTVLKLSDGCDFHVLSTSGNTALGGIDFDNELVEIVSNRFEKKIIKEFNRPNFKLHDQHKARIASQIENVKKGLSFSKKSKLFMSSFLYIDGQLLDINEDIERSEFEDSIQKYVDITKDCVDRALQDANLTYSDINEVVFVGGSTRIPLITEKIKEWFGKSPNKSINPDEAVSIGAAIQASVLSGTTDKEVYLIDVTPLSLGVETQGGTMSTMIKRNTQIPAQYTEIFTTAFDNQFSVDVKVFQGERPQTKNNYFLGEFKLDEIDPSPRGNPKIQVTFDVDANGILKVIAVDEKTSKEKELVLSGSSSLNELEISKLLKDAEENRLSDEIFVKITNLQNYLYDNLIQIDELFKTNLLNKEDLEELIDLKISIEKDIKSENIELLSGLVSSCKETINPISNKLYEESMKQLNEKA